MPWCPNCKSEYREGIKECAECKVDLVDELPDQSETILLVAADQEEILKKFVDYLAYSNIEAACSFIEADATYGIFVKEANLKKAKKAFAAFYSVEMDHKAQEEQDEHIHEEKKLAEIDHVADEEDLHSMAYEELDTEEEEESISKEGVKESIYRQAAKTSSASYVKKADQSKDLKSTAVTFTAFGIALLIFFALNLFKVITLFANAFSLSALAVLSIGCFLVAANSFKRAKTAAADSILEEELTAKLNEWMKENITKKRLENFADASLSSEVAYFKKTEGIKTSMIQVFGEIDDGYLDHIVEEFYSQYFE